VGRDAGAAETPAGRAGGAAMTGIAIRLDACGKTFADGTRALEPLDLEIRAGETVALLGPSGCGKTTTLRLIAGLDAPDAGGRVLFDGRDVTALPIEKRAVGMVFQSYALFPSMTVAGNVAYGLRIRGVARAERDARVAEMLAMMRIPELGGRSIDQLSGGQRQRVALARALAVRPRILLLDEPLTALDARLRDSLRVEIDQLLRGLAITAVYVTHDQAEAMALGDRIVVMSKGRVAQIGTPREIYFHPADAFVADFIGTVNRVPVSTRDGHLVFPGDGRVPWSGPPALEVCFRPQDVTLDAGGDGAIRTRVLASFFLGDRTRLVLDAGLDRPLTVETADRRVFTPGEAIDVTPDPERLMVL